MLGELSTTGLHSEPSFDFLNFQTVLLSLPDWSSTHSLYCSKWSPSASASLIGLYTRLSSIRAKFPKSLESFPVCVKLVHVP